jgi:ribonuclease P protein subunit RPR2
MPERSRRKPEYQAKIARERIDILFSESRKAPDDMARRYIKLAKKIGMRYNVKIGPQRKKLFCKNCFTPFRGGRTRLKRGFLVRECRYCGKITRMLFSRNASA